MVDTRPPDNVVLVRKLLDRGAALEVTDKDYRRTPLLWAIFWDRTATSILLIERGANIHAMDDYGAIPLKWAKENRNQQIIKMLKQAGAKEEPPRYKIGG